jgi:hypothetical protein
MSELLHTFRRKKLREKAATLVVTLLVLTLLSTIVVAFVQTVSMERSAARSVANRYQAELAAESAFEEAAAKILNNTSSDDFIILKIEANDAASTFPVYYAGVPQENTMDYVPLFSGGVVRTGLDIEDMPETTGIFESDVETHQDILVPKHISEGGLNPVRSAWITINNTAGDAIARYSYWVEDLGGYLDARLAGAKPLRRVDGENPSDLGIFTIFRPDEEIDSNPENGLDRKLIEQRENNMGSAFKTISTFGFIGLGDGLSEQGAYNSSDDFQKYFAMDSRYSDERAIVPRGFNYSMAGEPKKNLNDLVAIGGDEAVNQISTWIRDNLPDFDQRKGGFPNTQDYLKTLAANIIDYADADNEATVGADYRGVDSYPFVTQFYARTTWKQPPGPIQNIWYSSGSPATWRTKTTVQYFLQVWNPSDKVIDSGVLTLDLSPTEGSKGEVSAFYYDGSEVLPFFPFPDNEQALVYDFAASPLLPNEYRALTGPEFEYEVDTDVNSTDFPRPSHAHGNGPAFAKSGGGDINDFGYIIRWNGVDTDRPGAITRNLPDTFAQNTGVLQRHPTDGGTGPSWRGGQPGLRHGPGIGVGGIFTGSQQAIPLLGDPRGTYYLRDLISEHRYDRNASWWGRNKVSLDAEGNIQNWFIGEAKLNAWPDGAHHDINDAGFGIGGIPPIGNEGNPALRARRSTAPNDIPIADRPTIEQNKAPARISNSGEYRSLLELGNIYDPIQWRPRWDAGSETVASAENKWRNLGGDLDDPAAMVSDPQYVVPSTLRIGRGEYSRFDQIGKRASQLLDLFTLKSSVTTLGKININTASRDVLRTLGAGISISSDPLIEPENIRGENKLFGPLSEKQGDLLADAIIQSRPFISPAQLSNVKIEQDGIQTSFFGNMAIWSEDGPVRWLDTAAEEYFRKLFGLVTVRSRNFRVYVTGEALLPDGKVISRVNRVYQLAVEPVRRDDGAIESQRKLVVNKKDL